MSELTEMTIISRRYLFGISSRSCRPSLEPFNFSFFEISGRGIDLDYCDVEWFDLEMNRDHSVIFKMDPSTAFQTLLLTMLAIPFLLRDSCPQ